MLLEGVSSKFFNFQPSRQAKPNWVQNNKKEREIWDRRGEGDEWRNIPF